MKNTKPFIWMVDSDIDCLELFLEILEDDFMVKGFLTPAAALNDFSLGSKPDVLVTELKMSQGDGFSFIRDLRRSDFKNPIILLTQLVNPWEQMEAIKFRIFSQLDKPFPGELLLSKIRLALDGSRNRVPLSEEKVESLLVQNRCLIELINRYRDRFVPTESRLFESHLSSLDGGAAPEFLNSMLSDDDLEKIIEDEQIRFRNKIQIPTELECENFL